MKRITILMTICLVSLRLLSDVPRLLAPIEKQALSVHPVSLDSLRASNQKHGYLKERCVEFRDLDGFDGVLREDNYITPDVFSDLLRSVSTMTRQPSQWTPEDVLDAQGALNSPNTCPFAIAEYMFIKFKENALTDGLVKIENGYVKEIYSNGVYLNPYEDDVLFAVCPSDTLFDNSVTFSFPQETWKSNFMPPVYFDPGDGKGFRLAKAGSSMTIDYPSGTHELIFKMSFGAKTYMSHCRITTKSFSSQSSRGNVSGYFEKIPFNSNNIGVPETKDILWGPNNTSLLKGPSFLLRGSIYHYQGMPEKEVLGTV